MIERDVVDDVRLRPDEFQVALFCRFKQETFGAIIGNVKSLFRHEPAEAFPAMRFLVQGLKVVQVDAHGARIGQRLRIVIAGNFVDETFIGDYHLVREKQKYIFLIPLFIDHVRPEITFHRKAHEPADAP